MECPLNTKHRLIEIAHGVYQCPKCGFGPTEQGNFPFWAITNVALSEEGNEAYAVTYSPSTDAYSASIIYWGNGTLEQDVVDWILTPKEKDEAPLPVVFDISIKPKPKLAYLGWDSLGQKVL